MARPADRAAGPGLWPDIDGTQPIESQEAER